MNGHINNPSKAQLVYPYKCFGDVWKHAKKNNLTNERELRMRFISFRTFPDIIDRDGLSEAVEIAWLFNMDYLKSRCFDEAINLPYQMNETEMQQAFSLASPIEQFYGAKELSEWLKRTALHERERIMNEKYT